MMRNNSSTRRHLLVNLAQIALLPVVSRRASAAAGPTKRPNVLFIAVDDLRPSVGCYGDPYAKTPNIDAIARRGLRFGRAYCQQAVCAPSRASLMTGLRPDTIRVYNLDTSFRSAVPDAVTLPQHFKQHGYHVEAIGKLYHGNEVNQDERSWSVPSKYNLGPVKRDQYALDKHKDPNDDWRKVAATEMADVPDEAYMDGKVAAEAVRALGRIKDRPFFLGVGFRKPHLPFAAPKKYWDMHHPDDLPLAPNPEEPANAPPFAVPDYSELRSYEDIPDERPLPEKVKRHVLRGYYAATTFMDTNVGKVLTELDRQGLRDDTIIVLWGDHGWHLGEQSHWGKITNFEICVRAPLIVSVPGQNNQGAHTDALTEFVDIYPSLADLCGLPVRPELEGHSLAPLVDDPRRAWKKAAFSQYPRDGVMGHSMRTDRYRYTEWAKPGEDPDGVELYDHDTDPHESRNVAGRRPELVQQLSEQLHSGWRRALPDGT